MTRTVGTRGRAAGFSLIELLVAVLVMGIGVLGVTALQMVSLQNNRMALDRGAAVQLAYDITDRIRANPESNYQTDIGDAPPGAQDCLAGNCSTAQMMDFDLASWKCQLGSFDDEAVCDELRAAGAIPGVDPQAGPAQAGLPQGDGSIEWNGTVMTVTVQWVGNDGGQQTVVLDSQL